MVKEIIFPIAAAVGVGCVGVVTLEIAKAYKELDKEEKGELEVEVVDETQDFPTYAVDDNGNYYLMTPVESKKNATVNTEAEKLVNSANDVVTPVFTTIQDQVPVSPFVMAGGN